MERFIPKSIKEIKNGGEKYGGSDIDDWSEYEMEDTTPYFDKGGHKERSIANDPKHLEHWKKWKEIDHQ